MEPCHILRFLYQILYGNVQEHKRQPFFFFKIKYFIVDVFFSWNGQLLHKSVTQIRANFGAWLPPNNLKLASSTPLL